MPEVKVRKNTDYSASAINLTNPPQVMDLLAKIHRLGNDIEKIQLEIDDCIPQALLSKRDALQQELGDTDKSIRQAIDEFGSYQHVEYGEYALKQKRESIAYKPELVRQYAPSRVASFVLIESVDSKAFDAMVKTGQVTPEQARQCGEVKETYAYIIK